VHRLDKDTSGLLVVAKSGRVHEQLGTALAARRVRRRYAALAWGHLRGEERRIEAPLGRHPQDRKRVVVRAGGRHAVTRVRLVARGGVADLVRCTLETGRTHQIRVHLASIGHPVCGDAVYGGRMVGRSDASRGEAEALLQATGRQALHAAWLAFRHPVSGADLEFRSEWPDDLRVALSITLQDRDLLAAPSPLDYLGFFTSDEPR
jgi:23S rRNA pseudouridine1911/1915/1917 synthase